jgi:hypothetical protein
MTLSQVIEILKSAPRSGNVTDDPEGSHYIHISDTLASEMITALESVMPFKE